MASRTPAAAASSSTAAMPSRDRLARAGEVARALRQPAADQHEHVGAERRRLVDRPAVVVERVRAAVKKPPRHRVVTVRPASRTSRAAAAAPPASATWSRHRPIAPMPARAQPSAASATLQRFVVIWLRLTALTRAHGHPATASTRACAPRPARGRAAARPASASSNAAARCADRARALQAADHREVVLVAGQPGQEDDAGLVGEVGASKRWRESGTVGARIAS